MASLHLIDILNAVLLLLEQGHQILLSQIDHSISLTPLRSRRKSMLVLLLLLKHQIMFQCKKLSHLAEQIQTTVEKDFQLIRSRSGSALMPIMLPQRTRISPCNKGRSSTRLALLSNRLKANIADYLTTNPPISLLSNLRMMK